MTPHLTAAPHIFEAPATLSMPDLVELGGVSRVDPADPDEFDVTYFDTEDFDLLESFITIRRQTGGDEGWHLQVPSATSHHDIRIPLGQAVRTVPKRLRQAVAAVADQSAHAEL